MWGPPGSNGFPVGDGEFPVGDAEFLVGDREDVSTEFSRSLVTLGFLMLVFQCFQLTSSKPLTATPAIPLNSEGNQGVTMVTWCWEVWRTNQKNFHWKLKRVLTGSSNYETLDLRAL